MTMPASRDEDDLEAGADPPSSFPSNWTVHVSDIKALKISNISISASEEDIRDFFSFSGEIFYIEMQRESETSKLAYVTFKESKGADRAMLLTGAIIVDRPVTITPVENYDLPPEAFSQVSEKAYHAATDSAVVKKAEDMVSSMLAKGLVLGKDAVNKAKAFDERHRLISNASATVASIDRKIGISEKLSIGTAAVNGKVREVDEEKYQVLEKTRTALAAAEQKASMAGSALMNNRFVSTGASWVLTALNMVAKATEDVTNMTKEKVENAEEDKREGLCRVRTDMVNEFPRMNLDNEPMKVHSQHPPVVPVNSKDDDKLNIL